MEHIIYINGVLHHCTDPRSGVFYADHPSMPGRYCSQHYIGTAAALHILEGGGVRTSGNLYSMRPPMAEARVKPTLPKPKPLPTLAKPLHRRYAESMTLIVRALIVVWCLAALWVYTR